MARRGLVRVVCLGALAICGCSRESAEQGAPPAAAAPAVRPSAAPGRVAGPAALREALGIPPDARYETAPDPLLPLAGSRLKTQGSLGDLLQGDVFSFKAISLRTCSDAAASQRLPIVLGAEVEIRAKSRLTFSPRELRLQSGGVVYPASLDLERDSKECAPLLKVAWLKKDELIRGFVLFDVPPPRPENLELHYQPTRWGGAGHVRVTLANTPAPKRPL